MDRTKGKGVSSEATPNTTTKCLNVIAPDHPFWSQALSSKTSNTPQHQTLSSNDQPKKEICKESLTSNQQLGLSNLTIAGQPFQNNGTENGIHLYDQSNMNGGRVQQPTDFSNNLRLAPIGSSSAYQVSSDPLRDSLFSHVYNGYNIGPSQNQLMVDRNAEIRTSPEQNKSIHPRLSETSAIQRENGIWPSAFKPIAQKENKVVAQGVGPRFKNTSGNKGQIHHSSNHMPMTTDSFVSKSQSQQPPPRMMNTKVHHKNVQQTKNGDDSSVVQSHKPNPKPHMAYDDSSISLSSTDEEEDEEVEEDEYVNTDTGVWIYIAKSNIWVDSKADLKGIRNYKTNIEDKKLRLDLGRLGELVRKGRQVMDLQCYGSEPPDMDTIWKLAKRKGWTTLTPKSASKHESQLDISVSSDIMELVGCSHLKNLKFEKCKNVVVLLSSEAEDLTQIMGKIMNQEGWWRIEIWMTRNNISNGVQELAIDYPDIIEINYLDDEDIRETFQFTHYKLDLKGKVDKIDKRWLYNYGVVFEDVNLEIGSYVSEAFQKIIKNLNWPYKYVWIKDEKSRSDAVHLNLLILFERPNAVKNNKEKSEFLSDHLPKLRNSLLNDLCRRIVSYHEYDKEKNDDEDEISFTNRYSFLSDVKDEEDELESPEMSDEPVNAPFDLFEELERQEELLNKVKEKEKDWEQVIHKQRGAPSPAQIYPTRCIYGYICTYGIKCHYEHTNDEKQVFQARTAAKKIGKVPFHDNKYRTELCNFNIPHDRAACPFAHGMTQMICKLCYKCGHSVEACTVKEAVTP